MRFFFILLFLITSFLSVWSKGNCDTTYYDLNQKLLDAAYEGDYNRVLEALHEGAFVNATDDAGKSALVFVVEQNNLNIVKLLVEKSANVNVIPNSNAGLPPLLTAAKFGYLAITAYLLENKVQVAIRNNKGMSALHFAAFYNDTLLIELLLKHGANLSDTTLAGETPLLFGALNGSFEACSLLLAAGADVNAADRWGFTPLMVACQNRHMDVALLLMKSWALVNLKNKYGFTALSLAIANDYPEFVDLLLLNGANKKEQNSVALNPRTIAQIYNEPSLVDSFRKAGVRNNIAPFFRGFAINHTTFFNDKDLLMRFGLSTTDVKSKMEVGIHFMFRPSSIPVIYDHGDALIQFWERRYMLGLSLSRKINIITWNTMKAGLEPAVLYDFNFGKYRGTDITIKEGFMPSPELNWFLKFPKISFAISSRYTKFNVKGLSNWFLGFSATYLWNASPKSINKLVPNIQ